MTNEILIKLITNSLEEKKAEQIQILNLSSHGVIVDCMIIATATSSRHAVTLAEFVNRVLKDNGIKASIEGLRSDGWVLIDAGSVVVHIFKQEARDFYSIEQIWQ